MIEVRRKQSYFLRTFRIVEVMIFILLLLCLIRFPLGFIEKKFLSQANGFMLPYIEMMSGIFEWLINAVGLMILVSIGMISLIGIPELVYRITEDSIMNLLYSIWKTYQIRRFIFNKTNDMESNTGKSRIIQKSIIDIRKRSITYLVKLPNDLQSHKNFIEMKDILYKEIANQFPSYSFSQFERYKHWVRMDGTKIR